MAGSAPKIVFYTNRFSPTAHRVHIVLWQLGLQYEEVIIDLGKPREPWYLEINPRGQVPCIKYNDDIITESFIINQFLADLHPSHLFPPATTSSGVLGRARIQFFVDAWITKIGPSWYPILFKEGEEKEKAGKEFVETVKKEIEPLLRDAAPFVHGHEKLTLAEAYVGPMVLFIYNLIDGGLLPESMRTAFGELPHFSKWSTAVLKELSHSPTWDAEGMLAGVNKKMAELKAAAASAAAAAEK